jgi:hypothetical protein
MTIRRRGVSLKDDNSTPTGSLCQRTDGGVIEIHKAQYVFWDRLKIHQPEEYLHFVMSLPLSETITLWHCSDTGLTMDSPLYRPSRRQYVDISTYFWTFRRIPAGTSCAGTKIDGWDESLRSIIRRPGSGDCSPGVGVFSLITSPICRRLATTEEPAGHCQKYVRTNREVLIGKWNKGSKLSPGEAEGLGDLTEGGTATGRPRG